MEQIAEAIAIVIQRPEEKERAREIVDRLTAKYPLNA